VAVPRRRAERRDIAAQPSAIRIASLQNRKWIVIGAAGSAAGFGMFATASFYGPLFNLEPVVLRYLGAFGVALGLLFMAWGASREDAALVAHYRDREQKAIAAAAEAAKDVSSGTDTVGLLVANQRQMEAYSSIARSQAESSHRASQAAMGAGLLVLLVGGVVAYFVTDPATKFATVILASVGSVIGGYISRTFIAVQQRSTEQMGYYFQQPLVQSYLLSAERLARQMGDEQERVALMKILDTVLKSAPRPTAMARAEPGRSRPRRAERVPEQLAEE
jgi:hypothetical protein